jgi:hypothetical protein
MAESMQWSKAFQLMAVRKQKQRDTGKGLGQDKASRTHWGVTYFLQLGSTS